MPIRIQKVCLLSVFRERIIEYATWYWCRECSGNKHGDGKSQTPQTTDCYQVKLFSVESIETELDIHYFYLNMATAK